MPGARIACPRPITLQTLDHWQHKAWARTMLADKATVNYRTSFSGPACGMDETPAVPDVGLRTSAEVACTECAGAALVRNACVRNGGAEVDSWSLKPDDG